MSVRPIGNPTFEYTCDLCQTIERASWLPPNWEGISMALFSGDTAQLHVCQECITGNSIAFLINKVKAGIILAAVSNDE